MSITSLRASISIGVTETHVVPVADIEYILLEASAYMDTSGRFRYITDVIAVLDAARITTSKGFADAVALQDSSTRQAQKAVADSISLSETFTATLIFVRDFVETALATDLPSKTFIKPFAEQIGTTDAKVISLTKLIADGVNMDDSASVGDGIQYFYSKFLNNTTFVSDAVTIQNGKGFTDSFGTADAGILQMQDYCDITYFAEDYVGIARTF